ncbi:MAG: peptide ABC transporter substrate-binding protein [Anaerolineales bacterium]
MKRFRLQIIIVVLALVAIAILLISQTPNVLPGVEAIIQPASGGVYTEAVIGSLGRLNPLLDLGNPADQAVNRLLFSRLIVFDPQGIPQGDLVDSWGVSQDGTVYNFSINPEAVWHDGVPVTSEDVLFTIGMLRDENIPIPEDVREFWNQIEARPLDEKTLQFTLPEPFAPFLDYLSFGVLPFHLLGNLDARQLISDPFNINPVGSGPYKFDTLQIENGEIAGVELSVFENYYGDKPFIEKVILKFYPDSTSAFNAYQNGDVIGISEIPNQLLPSALKENDLNLYTSRKPRLNLIFLNQDQPSLPFFEDPVVRRALFLGINRRRIVDRILQGQAIIADGPIFPENWAYYDGIEHVKYDPDAAIALLREAGYTIPAEGESVRTKDDVKLSFELVYPNDSISQQIAESIKKDWEKIGVIVSLKMVSNEDLINQYLEPRTYQAALVEINLDGAADPDPYPFWHEAQIIGGQNYSGWEDRQASEYLEQARVLVDFEERLKRYRNFQVRFASEIPALPLFFPVYSYGVDKQVKGVSMGPIIEPSDRFNTIQSWYITAKSAVEVQETPEDTPGIEGQ